jgi:hypothetical protein
LPETQPTSYGAAPGDLFDWAREHRALLAGLAVVILLVLWLASGETRRETGRFVLVKDDVPCQAAGEGEGRRWCYLLLDTATGKLQERVRKLGGRD